ncbi:MAG: hypothetical protein IPM23_12665 [Candidatus Melainabacteria bacterium]|nr:hypothetical protein [Candidatus Melainabacteria bacterium]
MRRLLLSFLFVLIFSIQAQASRASTLTLWVWQYSADMSWVAETDYRVAYLAGTIRIGPRGIKTLPRTNSLSIKERTRVVAVVRIEVAPGLVPEDRHLDPLVKEILSLVKDRRVEALQIDFDATRSQRDFYRELLERLSSSSDLKLEMTALASWMTGDRWTSGLSVSKVVPMIFRMGRHRSEILRKLAGKSGLDGVRAVGLSVDEPDVLAAIERGGALDFESLDDVYLFSPRGWRSASAREFARIIRSKISD